MSEKPMGMDEVLAWLAYCLEETSMALEAVKEAALEAMGRDEAVSPEQFLAMCEIGARIITIRGQASRGFRASCPVPESRQADET